ncbi:hypothetical protein [Saccharothrix texasensis]|uniref:Uncharacterized protein n=1 Tax=Saccharothrix texasensis TaxID=103734 RepID=A0A3N1H1Z3_9PSEU|nr:hypothetical protein [Saccharothrix texasensis]ROP36272.1 hypothetical protein EDD40_1537 [Saccharothrix texasensis]
MTGPPPVGTSDRGPCLIRETHVAAEGYRTCDPCATYVRDALDDVVRLHPVVAEEAEYGTGGGDGPRGATVYRSGPPVNLARLDRADRLAQAGVLATLAYWADGVRESTGLPARTGAPTLAGEVVVLVRMWSWIRKQDAVGKFAFEVVELRRVLAQLAGETRGRIPVGVCPVLVDHDARTGAPIQCGQRLHARPGDRALRCPQCGTLWPAYRWVDLQQAQEATR